MRPSAPQELFSPGRPLPRDTGCLPAYRGSYARRYHPYPRYPRPTWEQYEYLMQTVDYRYVEERTTDVRDLDALSIIDEVGEEQDLANLERALKTVPEVGKRRRRLSMLVIELAFTVKAIVGLRRVRSHK